MIYQSNIKMKINMIYASVILLLKITNIMKKLRICMKLKDILTDMLIILVEMHML